MNKIFQLLELINAYIDDILTLVEVYLTEQFEKLELNLDKQKESTLKCNI